MTVSCFVSTRGRQKPSLDGFNRMRDDLVRRGLLDADYRPTAAGNEYVDKIIADLKAKVIA